MTAFTAFYDFLMPDLPGADTPLLDQRMKAVAADFCRRTKLLTYEVPAINVVAGTHSYTLTPETNMEASDIIMVLYDGVEIDPATMGGLDALYSDWRTTGTGTPKYYLSDNVGTTIRLVKTPDASITAGLKVTIAEAPAMTATVIPDFIYAKHLDDFCAGVKHNMMLMQKKPWSNPALAEYYKRIYESAVGIGDMKAARSGTRAPLRSTPQYR